MLQKRGHSCESCNPANPASDEKNTLHRRPTAYATKEAQETNSLCYKREDTPENLVVPQILLQTKNILLIRVIRVSSNSGCPGTNAQYR